MPKTYIQRPVTQHELEALARIAVAEEEAFFARNRHLVEPYRRRLLAIALCQGAAMQYIGRGYGINDFDIHFFYAQNPSKPRLSRAVGRVVVSVGDFPNVPVDFIRTVVSGSEPTSDVASVVRQLRVFLSEAHTANATHLAEKAVVGLSPSPLFGATIWPVV